MKILWSLFFSVFVLSTIQAQIIAIVPEYSTQPGAEELLDYTGTIYSHTGLNIDFGICSWGSPH